MMIATLAFVAMGFADERDALIERFWEADSAQFYTRTDAFGSSRIEMPMKIGRKHAVVGRTMKPEYIADRFLVGNMTEPFTSEEFRTTYLSLEALRPSKEKPKPSYSVQWVEKFVKQFWGKDFRMDGSNGWLVKGYRLQARKPCTTCHNWAKEGDALGYLVYAVGAKRAKVE